MKVPLLNVQRQNLPLEAELLAAFQRVLESGQYIQGAEVERFEAAAAEVAGARFAVGVSSGTDALLVALMALGIGEDDEVICPSFTFFATAGSIARVGARPVFADSCPLCFNIEPANIEALITPRTKAIIPVHLFGQPADMDTILEIARRHQLAVIEDTAQAFGATYRGRPVGALGDFGTISFFPSKNLGALGDAGLLVTNDAVLAEKARLLRNHGAHPKYFHSVVGGNFRLDAVQAALLAVKLPHLAEYTRLRQQHACEYQQALKSCRGGAAVELLLPETHPDRTNIANQFTLRVRRGTRWTRPESPRDTLRSFLHQREIGCEIYYPVPLHAQECFRGLADAAKLEICETLAGEVLSLPVFPELTNDEQSAVIAAVTDFMKQFA
ncbi:MAG TPA: DegT/DnrJ/EryC1/StrS family aminotransferase [Bryobacteraceae bacterium]|nr:DegT/DnrJ/EryC1/StrS family aminotransferase [Bryobacteraceae bacterium]